MANLNPLGGGNCTGCAALNGVWYADYVDSLSTPESICLFHVDMGSDPCSDCEIASMDMWVTLNCSQVTGQFVVTIEILNDAPTSPTDTGAGDCVDMTFGADATDGPPPDFCSGLASGSFFLFEQGGCDGSSATATLEFA